MGTHTYAAMAPTVPVRVFTSEREAPPGFEVVGLIDYDNPGKYQVLSLTDVLPQVQDKARSVGGDGIIIDATEAVKSGIMSTGIHVRARAIRLPAAAPAAP
jgi:hypothetical protein